MSDPLGLGKSWDCLREAALVDKELALHVCLYLQFACICMCFDSLGMFFDLKQNPAESSCLQIEASLNESHC